MSKVSNINALNNKGFFANQTTHAPVKPNLVKAPDIAKKHKQEGPVTFFDPACKLELNNFMDALNRATNEKTAQLQESLRSANPHSRTVRAKPHSNLKNSPPNVFKLR